MARMPLLFTDTDLLCYCTNSSTNIYDDMYQDGHMFDLISLPKESKYYNAKNMGVLGKMKDERDVGSQDL